MKIEVFLIRIFGIWLKTKICFQNFRIIDRQIEGTNSYHSCRDCDSGPAASGGAGGWGCAAGRAWGGWAWAWQSPAEEAVAAASDGHGHLLLLLQLLPLLLLLRRPAAACLALIFDWHCPRRDWNWDSPARAVDHPGQNCHSHWQWPRDCCRYH